MTYNVIAAPYLEQIEAATRPADLFKDADSARSTYRRLALRVHPDKNGGDSRCTAAFERLTELWDQYNGRATSTGPRPTKPSGVVSYDTKRHTFVVNKLIDRGDISNAYLVDYVEQSGGLAQALMKIPRSPKNSDLVANEITIRKELGERVPEQYRQYHGATIDSFRHRDSNTGMDRRIIVTEYLDGFVSLRDILRAYPTGVDPRDMAWMGRRLWICLAAAHDANIAHGAVVPEHVMVHPTDHAVVLIDWSYAQEFGSKLTAGIPRYINTKWYGTRYDQPLDHRLDIRQAATTLEQLLGLREARPFRAFFNGCRVASTPRADQLFHEFDELLERLYGARRYRPFAMPSTWRKEP